MHLAGLSLKIEEWGESVLKPDQWYIAKESAAEAEGPYSAEKILDHLNSGRVSWADGIWHITFGASWKRVFDIPDFSRHLPPLPPSDLIQTLSAARNDSQNGDDRQTAVWYLQFDGSEFGPMPLREIESVLKRGKLSGQLMGWKSGFQNWLPVNEIPEFQPFLNITVDAPSAIRHANRKAFVASIRFAEKVEDRSPDVFSGVARDISATGMRITSEKVPRAVGLPLIMSVQPVNTAEIPKFSVEAEVARIVGDRIFAVRFKAIDKAIEKAILSFTTGPE